MADRTKAPRYPGPRSAALLAELGQYVIAEPYPFVLDLEGSQGMWLATLDGQKVFDWGGQYGSRLLGYNHPRLREPGYLQRLARAANAKTANPDLLTPECVDYYRLLHSLAPECMRNPQLEVYAVNSGAEAVENLLKYLINLHDQKLLRAGRLHGVRRILYFDQAFHGRTVFALNVTQLSHDPVITKDFHGFIPGNLQVPFPDINHDDPAEKSAARTQRSLEIVDDLLQRYGTEVVGIVVEPVQGAGGQRVAQPEFFRGLSELAHRHHVPLGFDEVQTAGGQTGKVFACDLFDLPHPPQAVATAKKFANGAVYMLHPMDDRGVLDSTWGGALADMVRFVQEWTVVREERLLEQVPSKTAQLVQGLQELQRRSPDRLENVRGLGLYQGFTLRSPIRKSAFLERALEEEDLLLLGAGTDSIRLRPALDVSKQDIQLLLEKLERLLATAA
jgi:L-lysine 6-transaminase